MISGLCRYIHSLSFGRVSYDIKFLWFLQKYNPTNKFVSNIWCNSISKLTIYFLEMATKIPQQYIWTKNMIRLFIKAHFYLPRDNKLRWFPWAQISTLWYIRRVYDPTIMKCIWFLVLNSSNKKCYAYLQAVHIFSKREYIFL